jgi:tetratricopeptide (TPR) repeat protein
MVPGYVEGGFFDSAVYNAALEAKKIGNWDDATYQCVTQLKATSKHKKANVLLEEVAPKAHEKHIEFIKGYEDSNNWDLAVIEYGKIKTLVEAVLSVRANFPGFLSIETIKEKENKAINNAAETHYNAGIQLANSAKYEDALNEFLKAQNFVKDYKDIQDQINQTKEKIAEKYYNEGIALMKAEKHKEAAIKFRKCQEVIPYKDASDKYEKTREQALQKVCIMPFGNKSKVEGLDGILTGQIVEICSSKKPEFIEITTGEALELGQMSGDSTIGKTAKESGVHYFIKGAVTSVAETSPATVLIKTVSEMRSYFDFVYKVEVQQQCTVKTYQKKRSVNVGVTYSIIDAKTGVVKVPKNLSDIEADVCTWVEANVDPSWLSKSEKELYNVKREPDSAEELATRTIERFSKRIANEILDYFK